MRRRGFTLLELLVATSVLVVLGASLVVILRGGVKTWRRSEARRESFEVFQAVLAQLGDDLAAATIDPQTSHGGGPVEAIFLGDADDDNRCRLALVRTIRGESESAITGHAGSSYGGTERIDYRDDLKDALDRRLRATGGLMEVAWCLGKRGTPDGEVLFRGIRSPVGGATSFFGNSGKNFFRAPLPGAPAGAPAPEGAALCRAFATRVVHFELLYGTPYTNTWAPDVAPRRSTKGDSGPLVYWDSTRAILATKEKNPKLFTTFVDRSSRADPADDILPARVKVTIVVREGDAAESSVTLFGDITQRDQSFRVDAPARLSPEGGFVYLDQEWIQYDEVNGDRVRVKARGMRGTSPAPHGSGTEVVIGRTFEAVLPVAAAREDWGDGR